MAHPTLHHLPITTGASPVVAGRCWRRAAVKAPSRRTPSGNPISTHAAFPDPLRVRIGRGDVVFLSDIAAAQIR